MKTILVVDDEPKITQLARDYLEHAGFGVLVAGDGPSALTAVRQRHPDLVVLDLGLPGLDGLDVTRELRRDSTIPIVMLTARDDELDKLLGLELGADDYITKPFSSRELALRVKAVLRRSNRDATDAQVLRHDSLELDASRRRCNFAGREVELTTKEFELLATLMKRPGRVLTREQLLDTVWGHDVSVTLRTIDTHVRRLREKLGDAGEWIGTVRGVGYRFEE